MKKKALIFSLFLLPILASCFQKQVYIVYFGEHSGEKALHEIEDNHHSYLRSVKDSEDAARASLLYSYKHSINGFAAILTPEEASKLSEVEEVVSVFKTSPGKYERHTTRSWEFVGLEETEELNNNNINNWDHFEMGGELLRTAKYGEDVIIGVLDSGVWPESKSFSDKGMGPIPESWKGICQTGPDFYPSHCNKKLIGARFYSKAYMHYYGHLNVSEDTLSPRDMDGHGSHTASTVGGRRVPGASFSGFARGTASGGAPLSRLAIYKACWAEPNATKENGNVCFEEDMLAAIDDAIADGVHVLSVSIGTTKPLAYSQDGIAIGALHAVKNNIIVAASAGNNGPGPSTLSNPAPWIITVGASSLDRDFFRPLVLGNGVQLMGKSLAPGRMGKMHPLVYAEDVVIPGIPKNLSSQCLNGSLSPEKVKGKIVLCMRGTGLRIEKGLQVKNAGGVGFILGNTPEQGNQIVPDQHFLPATHVGAGDTIKIIEYIRRTRNPRALIKSPMTVLHSQPAPVMAVFSSRGPNVLDPYILKPDIAAPGVNILAAWSGADGPTKWTPYDNRSIAYNLYSGTSMSCPHIAASAALIKAIHPNWSSAAIRSALMTTAWMKNDIGSPLADYNGKPANPFAFGSGHFRPTKAADPGLVYDASYTDYLLYLCSDGLTNIDPLFNCPKEPPSRLDLNYPSIAISNLNDTVVIKRTVTNVGNAKSIYFFSAKPPVGVSVTASPSLLMFDQVDQKKSFTITIKRRGENVGESKKSRYDFGWYAWSDRIHIVRSPMAVSLA